MERPSYYVVVTTSRRARAIAGRYLLNVANKVYLDCPQFSAEFCNGRRLSWLYTRQLFTACKIIPSYRIVKRSFSYTWLLQCVMN